MNSIAKICFEVEQYQRELVDYHRAAIVQVLTESLYLVRAEVLDQHSAELAAELKIPQIEAHSLLRPAAERVYRAAVDAVSEASHGS